MHIIEKYVCFKISLTFNKKTIYILLLIFLIFLLVSCQSAEKYNLDKNETYSEERLNILNLKKAPELKINGPFFRKDKIKASNILAKLFCEVDGTNQNKKIEDLFKKRLKNFSLDEGLIYSPQVIKSARELEQHMSVDCSKILLEEDDKEKIYIKNFRFDKH